MKKILGLLALALLFSITLNAQQKKERIEKREQLTSEQRATLQAKKLALRLDLDENQQKSVFKMMKKNADEREKQRAYFKEKGVQPTSEERFQFKNNRLDKQLEYKAAMKKILTKDQFTKWETQHKGNMNRFNNRLKKETRKMHQGKSVEKNQRNTKGRNMRNRS